MPVLHFCYVQSATHRTLGCSLNRAGCALLTLSALCFMLRALCFVICSSFVVRSLHHLAPARSPTNGIEYNVTIFWGRLPTLVEYGALPRYYLLLLSIHRVGPNIYRRNRLAVILSPVEITRIRNFYLVAAARTAT